MKPQEIIETVCDALGVDINIVCGRMSCKIDVQEPEIKDQQATVKTNLNWVLGEESNNIELVYTIKLKDHTKESLIKIARDRARYLWFNKRVGLNRSRNVCDARNIAIVLIKETHLKDYSYRAIAEMFGRLTNKGKGDHAFVINAELIGKQLLKNKDKGFTEKYAKSKCEILKKSIHSINDNNYVRKSA